MIRDSRPSLQQGNRTVPRPAEASMSWRDRSGLPQGFQNRAGAALVAMTGADGPRQFTGHALQVREPSLDIAQVLARQLINLAARQVGILRQAQQAADFFQAEAKVAAAGDEAQPLDIGVLVRAISTADALRAGHQPDPLVIADRFQMAAAGGCRLTDFHSHLA